MPNRGLRSLIFLLALSLAAPARAGLWERLCALGLGKMAKQNAVPTVSTEAVIPPATPSPTSPTAVRATPFPEPAHRTVPGPILVVELPTRESLADTAATASENQTLLKSIEGVVKKPVDVPGLKLPINEDMERLLALIQSAQSSLADRDVGKLRALGAEVRRLAADAKMKKRELAGIDELVAMIEAFADFPKEGARRLSELRRVTERAYFADQRWAQFMDGMRKGLEALESGKGDEFTRIVDSLLAPATEANAQELTDRKLDGWFRENFGTLAPSGANLEKIRWILRNEKDIARSTASLLGALDVVDVSDSGEVDKAVRAVWPRPPDPVRDATGLLSSTTGLGTLSLRPATNGFAAIAKRDARFLDSVYFGGLQARAHALTLDDRVPLPRRRFLAGYLATMQKHGVKIENGDTNIKNLVQLLEELYLPARR